MKAIDLSALVYKTEAEVRKRLEGKDSEVYWIDIPDSDIQAVCVITDTEVWVAIRGTEITNLRDWKRNFNYDKVSSRWGFVHEGFYTAAKEIAEVIYSYLGQDILNKKYYFTGHSMGGAVAVQLFAYFMGLIPVSAVCIPIEAPRSCSELTAEVLGTSWGSLIYPVVNNNDIVWNIPPKAMNFRHVYYTNVQYIDRKGSVHHKISKWNKFYDSTMGYIRSWLSFKVDSLADHDIGTIRDIWRKQLCRRK